MGSAKHNIPTFVRTCNIFSNCSNVPSSHISTLYFTDIFSQFASNLIFVQSKNLDVVSVKERPRFTLKKLFQNYIFEITVLFSILPKEVPKYAGSKFSSFSMYIVNQQQRSLESKVQNVLTPF